MKEQTITVAFRVPTDMAARLETVATQLGVKRSELMRQALQFFIEDELWLSESFSGGQQ